MKILVYPHDMNMGGSQINAIQIAGEVARLGHEVAVYGQRGSLVDLVGDYGLEYIEAPAPGRRPSPRVVADLRRLVAERGFDVIHGYEWPPALEAHLATRTGPATAVATVLSMAVAPFIPYAVPLLVGTEQIAAAERLRGRDSVHVLEPPVDLSLDGPDVDVDVDAFRRTWGLDDGVPTVVVVTRLAAELKLEGVLTAVRTVGRLARRRPVRLVVVGDGPSGDRVRTEAAAANEAAGRTAVVCTGQLADPRAAYAAADVMLGMGGSALRALAYEKPLVVQGEGGFWARLDEASAPQFLWTGWYGYGSAGRDPEDHLAELLDGLLDDPIRAAELGVLGRDLVERRFSLAGAGRRQAEVYAEVVAGAAAPARLRGVVGDGAAAARWADYQVRRRVQRLRGHGSVEDFNARPLAQDVEPAATGEPAAQAPLLWFAGAPWDGVPGTDRRLVTALVERRPVVWVDPPTPLTARWRGRPQPRPLTLMGPNLLRVHPMAPPGLTRPGVRSITGALVARQAAAAVDAWGRGLGAVIGSSADQLLPRTDAPTVYYATDDFVAGADLMGVSARRLRRQRRRNVARSRLVLGVTAGLARTVAGGRAWAELPNGCEPERYAAVGTLPPPTDVDPDLGWAGVVGQFNDRLDLDLLDRVAATGVPLLLVGPRHELSPDHRAAWDRLLARPGVRWLGAQPAEALPALLGAVRVGLTPYADSAFNRASYPLKTLEYLSAGLPVVTTDLPASRALEGESVVVADDAGAFVAAVRRFAAAPPTPAERAARRRIAAGHSWAARADRLLALLGDDRPPAAPTTRLAVVVVTYNSADHVSDLLTSLPAAADGLALQVVVVDNASRDDTVARVVAHEGLDDLAVVSSGGNAGYSAAINVGRQHVDPTLPVAILNPDLRLEPGALRRLVDVLDADPAIGIAAPRLLEGDGATFPHLRVEPTPLRALGDALAGSRWPGRPQWLSEQLRRPEQYEAEQDVAWAGGAALVVSAACNAAVGAWDQDRFFLYSEETDYAERARRAGFRVRYVPQARAWHEQGGSGSFAGLIALMSVNKVRQYETGRPLPSRVAFRGAVAVHHALRAHRPANRHALRVVVSRRRWADLPAGEPVAPVVVRPGSAAVPTR